MRLEPRGTDSQIVNNISDHVTERAYKILRIRNDSALIFAHFQAQIDQFDLMSHLSHLKKQTLKVSVLLFQYGVTL